MHGTLPAQQLEHNASLDVRKLSLASHRICPDRKCHALWVGWVVISLSSGPSFLLVECFAYFFTNWLIILSCNFDCLVVIMLHGVSIPPVSSLKGFLLLKLTLSAGQIEGDGVSLSLCQPLEGQTLLDDRMEEWKEVGPGKENTEYIGMGGSRMKKAALSLSVCLSV